MALRTTKLHAVAPRENLDRAAFVLAFVVGVVGGIILKLVDAHAFIAAGYSALILIAYAIVAWLGGRVKIEPEAIGDNCYYLGFLFTLASLAFTLYQMADPTTTGGKPVDIPDVISGFGVALSSTIFGVFLRVLMMQMRPDFVAKDRSVRADLNKSYADFRKNLSGVLSQMKSFSTESIQMAAERDIRIREGTESFVKDHQAALQAAADELSKNMENAFTEASKRAVSEISRSVQEANEEARGSLLDLVEEIRLLKDRLKEQETQTYEDIESRRRRLNLQLEEAERRMQSYDQVMEDYIKVTRRASDAMSKRIVPALDAFKERLEDLPKDADFSEKQPISAEDLEAAVERPFTLTPTSRWGKKKADS